MTIRSKDIIIIINNIIIFENNGDFMNKDFMKIIMNPIRQRIVQYLIIHGQGTTKEIGAELSDIPPASLYRHVKVLFDNNCIEIADEKKIRGTIERTWKLAQNPIDPVSPEDIATLFRSGLLSLLGSFETYFLSEDVDPQRDLLSLTTSTIMLTDEEFMDMMQKIGNIFNEVIYNQPGDGRKPRRLTFISSPCEKED